MINAKERWRKSKVLRITSIVAAAIALLFVAGFPLGGIVKSDYLNMMRDTVLESENGAADVFLAGVANASAPEEAVYILFHLMLHNITYIADNDDYSKTPNEFIRDRGGDCEDFATFVSYALTKASVPNRIVVYFSLYGHAYNEFMNSSGGWQTLDFLDKPYGKYFANKSYFHPAGTF
ncbi:MAG: transglutaminase-like domain-containing protein, partial [Candidatus Thermoplasmatota archaeon]|nr:transglutaminase-like domain-containing protein [Candidatus Thermoplasmatota archaeon]